MSCSVGMGVLFVRALVADTMLLMMRSCRCNALLVGDASPARTVSKKVNVNTVVDLAIAPCMRFR